MARGKARKDNRDEHVAVLPGYITILDLTLKSMQGFCRILDCQGCDHMCALHIPPWQQCGPASG